jgi:hypothetical protein
MNSRYPLPSVRVRQNRSIDDVRSSSLRTDQTSENETPSSLTATAHRQPRSDSAPRGRRCRYVSQNRSPSCSTPAQPTQYPASFRSGPSTTVPAIGSNTGRGE